MLFSIFFYMFPSLVDNRADMIICQRIKNRFSLSTALYQFILFQNTKLMRNRRLSHIQCFGEIADAYLCLKQNKQNAYSGRVSENLEKFCQIIKLCLLRQSLIYNLQQIFMNLKTITYFIFTLFHSVTCFLSHYCQFYPYLQFFHK